MKYCTKCGNAMEDDMHFCQKCGTKTEAASQYQRSQSSSVYPTGSTTPEIVPKKKNGSKFLAIILCLFMPYIGIFYVLIKKPFEKKARIIWSIYCIIMCVIVISVGINANSNNSSQHSSSISQEPKETTAEQIALTASERKFAQAFECTDEQAKNLCAIFDEVGLALSSKDNVSRREDLDNWDNDGSVAYEVADVIRVDGENQRAFLYLTSDYSVIDISFLSCYLYEDGTFVQTAERAVNVGWAELFYEDTCPVSVSAYMTTDSIGTPVIKATIKNDSDKKIAAIKILAQPLDVYGNSIQNYGYGEKYTSLNSDEAISAGSTKSVSWSLYGYDTAKKTNLWIYSVYFEDGTQWGSYDGLSVAVMQEYGASLTAE